MIKTQVLDLKKTMINEDLDNEQLKRLGVEIIEIFHDVSELTYHNDSQYSFDSGVVKALSNVFDFSTFL